MTPGTGEVTIGAGARGPRRATVVRREMPPAPHAIATWSDAVTALWLAAGVPGAMFSRSQRWRMCRAVAGVMRRGARGAADRERIQRLGRLAESHAVEVDRSLYAARFATNLSIVRALVRSSDYGIVTTGLDILDTALAGGRGAIVWVSDFAAAGDVTKIALFRAGHRVKHLSRPEHGFSESAFGIRVLNPIRLRFERAYLDERVIFDRARPAAAVSRLARHLRANGVVSISVGAYEGRSLVEADLLGGRIKVATGALRLAAMSGAPLLPVFTLARPDEPGVYDVVVEAPLSFPPGLSEEEALLAAATDYIDRLEQHIIQRPECWVGWRRRGHFD